jgi:hypothetical protein
MAGKTWLRGLANHCRHYGDKQLLCDGGLASSNDRLPKSVLMLLPNYDCCRRVGGAGFDAEVAELSKSFGSFER